MILLKVIFCLALISSGFSQELKGLVLARDPTGVEVKQEGITIEGLEGADELALLLEPFLGQEIASGMLQGMREVIAAFAKMRVEIPEQEVTDGIVVLKVEEISVNQVHFTGQKYFPKWQFEQQIPLRQGEPLVEADLLNAVAWLNQNPFHRTKVIIAQGDLQVETKDRWPVSPFISIDNTGTGVTGSNRLVGGVNIGNAFWVGDLLSYQFISSSDFYEFVSNYANYTSFLPWFHQLVVYGGWAKIHPNLTNFKSNGQEMLASLRYKIPVKPLYIPFQQEWSFGLDYKLFNSSLFFVDTQRQVLVPMNAQYVTVSQLYAGYFVKNQWKMHDLLFRFEVFGSPLGYFPHQTDADYDALREGALPFYAYAKLTFGDLLALPKKFSLSFLLRAQGATGPLLPSEQFGLGGFDTIRGYPEREFNADNFVCLNTELRTPLLIKDTLLFLGFCDVGAGYNSHPIPGNDTSQTLLGTGLGGRLTIAPWVALRADLGFRLAATEFIGLGHKLHFSASVRY